MAREPSVIKLNVLPRSHQSGKSRYSSIDDSQTPSVASWRNNLTALSQYYNLLFVACVDKIHVFKPSFPEQAVRGKPELIINLPVSRPGLEGYIDRRRPHAVNHLIVEVLGNHEILLVGCDDGDVVAYYTWPITKAIDRNSDQNEDSPLVYLNRPFFLENAGCSAWGLAVHKRARLIAVSSNTHSILVFKFALGQDWPSNSRSDPECSDWSPLDSHEEPLSLYDLGPHSIWKLVRHNLDRSNYNIILPLRGHRTNIPGIAFWNSPTEEAEIYLASTDLNGNRFIWNVDRREPILIIKSDESGNDQRGWNVACLDPRYARLAADSFDTYGCKCSYDALHYRWDNSENVRLVPDNSQWHPAFSKLSSMQGVSLGLYTNGPSVHLFEPVEEADILNSQFGDSESEDSNSEGETVEYLSDDASHTEPERSPRGPTKEAHAEYDKPNLQQKVPTLLKRSQTILPFNLLFTSETDISLIEEIGVASSAGPIGHLPCREILCQKAVDQATPPRLQALELIKRLNMTIQVPDLGVVAVANQAGRVALLTMTYWKSKQQSGFKIEATLPYKSQEDRGIRPEVPLMGMAISPVQGQELEPETRSGSLESPAWTFKGSPRRYRLLMTYYDHTVLSYEFFRSTSDDSVVVI